MLTRLANHTRRTILVSLATGFVLQFGLAGCRDSAPDDLIQQESTTDALVFVKTDGTETLNRSAGHANLFKLSPIAPDGVVTPITNYVNASISDPAVSFDGKKILFSMQRQGDPYRNIWEINADGTGLRQVTSGAGPDFDPLYLPDDRIMFTSSRDGEMDEYNRAPAEHMYTCDADGSNPERISFNQSDDFDPELLPDGRVVYTRWEHFGTMNRFPLFFMNPDGTGIFHEFGPHNRNFFHPTVTPDGRLIAIESTRIEGDSGPLAMLKTEDGPADPVTDANAMHWDVVTPLVNNDGEPWPHGAFKYPRSIGGNRYVCSYSLPAAEEDSVHYGLYTFTLNQTGAGTPADPATFTVGNMTFLYNDPTMNEYDAQLLAPHARPPVIASVVDHNLDYGVFMAQDIFNRGTNDGQERPVKGATGINHIDSIAVIAARPTTAGMMNNFSANDFERRALIGFAPVESDGSFRIKVPANTPISFATLDSAGRGFVVKRTHLAVRPGEEFNRCVGCHENRAAGGPVVTNTEMLAGRPAMAATHAPTDLNIPQANWQIINYEQTIGPIVAAKCVTCHYAGVDTVGGALTTLDLSAVADTTTENRIFPRGYINLSGDGMMAAHQVVDPAFPRRSILIDYVLGLGSQSATGPHPTAVTLTPQEKRQFNLWVLLGAQYK